MKKVSKGKRITIDQLASMVAKGFLSVHNDIQEVKNQINEVWKHIDKVDTRLDRIETNHERRIDIVESRAVTLKSALENQIKKKIIW